MYELLTVVERSSDLETLAAKVKQKLKAGMKPLPLFEAMEALDGRTLYRHLQKFGKYKYWTLSDFIAVDALDLKSRDSAKRNVMQRLVADENLTVI